MNITENLLITAAEECNEIAQRITKALRFGLTEVQKGQSETNAQRIIGEFNDLVAVLELLQSHGDLPPIFDHEHQRLKRMRVVKWMEYSRDECGTLQTDTQNENTETNPDEKTL